MTETDPTPNTEDFERRIARLKTLSKLGQLALPLVAASAAVAAIGPIAVFPIAAAIAAVAVAAREAFVRHERKELDADLKELRKKGNIDPRKLAELSSEANRLTVGGPSN